MTTPAPPAAVLDRAVAKLRTHADCTPHIGYASISHEEAAALLAKLEAADRLVEACERLWALCVEEGFPWSDGSVQDELTALGFLVAKDMTAEDSGPECKDCMGGCETCYRSIESLAAYRAPQRAVGECNRCGGPVYNRAGKPGEFDHKCNPQPKEPT